jgi:hypothetical protein
MVPQGFLPGRRARRGIAERNQICVANYTCTTTTCFPRSDGVHSLHRAKGEFEGWWLLNPLFLPTQPRESSICGRLKRARGPKTRSLGFSPPGKSLEAPVNVRQPGASAWSLVDASAGMTEV